MSTVKTFGHFLYESGARGTKGRYNPDSKITPSSPLVDGWERGTFNPDGVTFKDRYGFSLQETNGSPVGESVGLTGALSDAIHDLSNPFMIADNQHYVVSTYWDVCDARYVMAGEQTAYSAIVTPIIQRLAPTSGQPNFPPPSPPVIPVDPNPQPITDPVTDPCASVKAQLVDANQKLAIAQHSLTTANAQLDSANASVKTLAQIGKILASVEIPNRGGGWPINTLRKIDKLVNPD